MDKREIIDLLDALSERPFAGDAEASARLTSFCRAASAMLAEDERGGDRSTEMVADTEAMLVALISDAADAQTRELFAQAASRSAALRLDAESARACVAAVEASPQQAPAHLVADVIVAAGGAVPRASASGTGLLARIAAGDWLRANWRAAAACAVLVVGVGIAVPLYWPGPQRGESAVPVARTASPPPLPRADAPPALPSAIAAAPPCQPGATTPAVTSTAVVPNDTAPAPQASAADCATSPSGQLADRPVGAPGGLAATREELVKARSAAEAAKLGAAARAPASASTQATQEPHPFGGSDASRPAANRMAPAAAPAATMR